MNGNGKVKWLFPVLIIILLLMVAMPLMSFASNRRRMGGSALPNDDEGEGDENSFRPPARGYLGPGPSPAPAHAPAPVPTSSLSGSAQHHHGHHRPYPYPYYPGGYYYGYPYTDALVLRALANEASARNCYKEIAVRTEGYGIRNLCLSREEYISRLKKEINKERTNYENAIKSGKVLVARRAKSRVTRLSTELRVEVG